MKKPVIYMGPDYNFLHIQKNNFHEQRENNKKSASDNQEENIFLFLEKVIYEFFGKISKTILS